MGALKGGCAKEPETNIRCAAKIVAVPGFGTEFAAFVVGAGSFSVGHIFAHHYTVKRERTRDISDVVDRAIEAFVAADQAVNYFLSQVGTGRPPADVQAAADAVSAR